MERKHARCGAALEFAHLTFGDAYARLAPRPAQPHEAVRPIRAQIGHQYLAESENAATPSLGMFRGPSKIVPP